MYVYIQIMHEIIHSDHTDDTDDKIHAYRSYYIQTYIHVYICGCMRCHVYVNKIWECIVQQVIRQWRVRLLVEMRAMHSIIILCFDSKLQLHDLPRTLRDAFYIINQTFCPLIIVLASRVIRLHLCVSCLLLRPLVHTLSDLLLWS